MKNADRRRKILAASGLVLFVLLMAVLSFLFTRPIIEYVKDPDPQVFHVWAADLSDLVRHPDWQKLRGWVGSTADAARDLDPQRLRLWVAEKGLAAHLIFIGIVTVQVVVAFIPGEVVEIAAGVAFGPWMGALLCEVGAFIGSTLVFLFVRKWGVRVVEVFFPPEKIRKLQFLKTEKRTDTFLFLLLFIPGTPKDLISYFAGLTPVKFSHFLWITLIARIPSIITSTWGGDALLQQNWVLAVIIFAATGAVSLLGLWLFEVITSRRSARREQLAQEETIHLQEDQDA